MVRSFRAAVAVALALVLLMVMDRACALTHAKYRSTLFERFAHRRAQSQRVLHARARAHTNEAAAGASDFAADTDAGVRVGDQPMLCGAVATTADKPCCCGHGFPVKPTTNWKECLAGGLAIVGVVSHTSCSPTAAEVAAGELGTVYARNSEYALLYGNLKAEQISVAVRAAAMDTKQREHFPISSASPAAAAADAATEARAAAGAGAQAAAGGAKAAKKAASKADARAAAQGNAKADAEDAEKLYKLDDPLGWAAVTLPSLDAESVAVAKAVRVNANDALYWIGGTGKLQTANAAKSALALFDVFREHSAENQKTADAAAAAAIAAAAAAQAHAPAAGPAAPAAPAAAGAAGAAGAGAAAVANAAAAAAAAAVTATTDAARFWQRPRIAEAHSDSKFAPIVAVSPERRAAAAAAGIIIPAAPIAKEAKEVFDWREAKTALRRLHGKAHTHFGYVMVTVQFGTTVPDVESPPAPVLFIGAADNSITKAGLPDPLKPPGGAQGFHTEKVLTSWASLALHNLKAQLSKLSPTAYIRGVKAHFVLDKPPCQTCKPVLDMWQTYLTAAICPNSVVLNVALPPQTKLEKETEYYKWSDPPRP